MIKARNRKLSILLVLTMLMTMFIGVGTASAAASFTVLSAPTVKADGGTYDLGTVKVELEDVDALPADGAWLTIALPSGCEYTYQYAAGTEVISTANISVGQVLKTADDVMEILVTSNYVSGDADGSFTIEFCDIKVTAGSGDIVAKFLSNSSVFGTQNTAVIGKIGAGTTTVMAKSVKTISGAGGEIDTLVIAETMKGVFHAGETIKLLLPAGFTWNDDSVTAIAGAWGLAGSYYSWQIDPSDPRILEVYIGDSVSTDAAGRINIGSDIGGYFAIIAADTAENGDVYVTVSSDKGAVEMKNVLVAEYVGIDGDVNRNGDIDTEDAALALSAFAGLATLTESQLEAADMNKDGKVNSADATLILQEIGEV